MKRKWLFQLIGLILFIFILYKSDLRSVFSLISDANLTILLLALLLTIPFVIIKSLRWHYLLKMQGIDYAFKNSTVAYLGSMYLGIVTPGRIGDFVKVLYLKNEKNISFSKGFSSVFVDRLFDLLILLLMACAGVLTFALPKNILMIIFILLLLFLALIFIFMNKLIGKKVINILLRVILPKKRQDVAKVKFTAFYSGIEQLKNLKIVYPLLLTIISYTIFYIQCYLIAKSLNISISYLNVAFSISTANLVSLLPISISGIGTRDATLISIFSVLNLSKESALVFSIMFLFISNISTCIIGAIAWFKKPVDIKF